MLVVVEVQAIGLSVDPRDPPGQHQPTHVDRGFTAVKLRGGDRIERDLARVRRVRQALADNVELLIDMNTLADPVRHRDRPEPAVARLWA